MQPPTPTNIFKTGVRAGSEEIAWQNGDSGGSVVFQATDSAGMSLRSAEPNGDIFDAQGSESSPAELDPLGNNVGTHGSLSDPRNSEGEVSPANRSTVSADAFCSRAGVVGPCWIVSLLNRGQTMGSKGSDLPMEMVGDSHPASLSRHPFYFAFYRNSIEAAEDDGRWIKTDWDVIYEEVFLGYNDKGEVQYRIDIVGTISNTMTFIPPDSLPGLTVHLRDFVDSFDKSKYEDCASSAWGKSRGAFEPGYLQAGIIRHVSRAEGVSETLLAATWRLEGGTTGSEFAMNPVNNGNDGTTGNVDIGPGQINCNTWANSSILSGMYLETVFGASLEGGQTFDGDPEWNLHAVARILRSFSGTDRNRAGKYRTGDGQWSKKPAGRSAYDARVSAFDRLKSGYDKFFNCLRK